MLVVKLEIWPHGDQQQARTVGLLTITNDGTGDERTGSYDVSASHAGKFFGRRGVYKSGKVASFARRLSPYRLLARALRAIGET